MKIGLYGGTFNPFHNGHIGISRFVLEDLSLDQILFIPSAMPPHKPDKDLVSAKDRFEMVRQSLFDHDKLMVSDIELNRSGTSYTIDTIHDFKQAYAADTAFYLLMGSDAFLDITTWKATEQLFKAVKIVIMLRGEWKNTDRMAQFIDENISKGYSFKSDTQTFSHTSYQDIIICKVPKIDISSTLVRDRIKQSQSIVHLVPGPVEEMIRTKELYI